MTIDFGNPDLGKTPEELALWREIAAHAAAGREPEREDAAWRLADMLMRRAIPGVVSVGRVWINGQEMRRIP